MSQEQKKEAMLTKLANQRTKDGMIYRERDGAIAHARDLARKLDSIMRVLKTCDISYGEMSEIRAIVDPE